MKTDDRVKLNFLGLSLVIRAPIYLQFPVYIALSPTVFALLWVFRVRVAAFYSEWPYGEDGLRVRLTSGTDIVVLADIMAAMSVRTASLSLEGLLLVLSLMLINRRVLSRLNRN